LPDRIPADWPPVRLVEDEAGLETALSAWRGVGVLGVDTEANSFHAYRERLCLLQVTAGEEDWILDPIALGAEIERLRPLFADPGVTKVFHAAEYDLMLLRREAGLEVRGLFDTQVAMTLLGHKRTGLASLLEDTYGVAPSKKEQRSDWGKRPLSPRQIAYARLDTHFLPDLHARLSRELEEKGMMEHAEHEFRRLEREVLEPKPPDPERWRKLKGAKALDDEGRARLQALFRWRESEAERRDVPPFKVLGNEGLVALAARPPRSVKELAGLPGIGWKTAKRHGEALLRILDEARGNKVEDLKAPKVSAAERRRRRTARENLEALRRWRSDRARELDLPSERLLHRRQLEAIARALPRDREALLAVVPLDPWQEEHLADSLLAVLASLPDSGEGAPA